MSKSKRIAERINSTLEAPKPAERVPLTSLTPGDYLRFIASCEDKEVRGDTLIQAKRADDMLRALKLAAKFLAGGDDTPIAKKVHKAIADAQGGVK